MKLLNLYRTGELRVSRKILFTIVTSLILFSAVSALYTQDDQASLLLDLKKARASYEIMKQKLENDRRLFEQKAISEDEYNNTKNQFLSSEVEYQKLILKVMAQQSYIIIEKAVKYQKRSGEKRVKITLRGTMEGNQEYLDQFKEHFEVFTPEMRSSRIYNIFVSLISLEDKTIIGSPYEVKISTLKLGESAFVDFGLLKDVESLQVSLNYGSRQDQKNIYLEKDGSADIVAINSMQFSQEADLGSKAIFDLTLERFSASDDIYQLMVLNLPRQIGHDFTDSETNARLSQIKFTQGVNTKKLILQIYLPDRDDEQIVIDKPIVFYALVLSRNEYEKIQSLNGGANGHHGSSNGDEFGTSIDALDQIKGGKVRLELIPRGIGRIEVRSPSLYHEISAGDSVKMDITIRNNGTRRLDNIRVSTNNPLHWRSVIRPDLIKSLDPEKGKIVSMVIIPPHDVEIGAQEVKIKTEAIADNRRVESEDKTVRILIKAKVNIWGTAILIIALIGFIVGIVIFGIKISRR